MIPGIIRGRISRKGYADDQDYRVDPSPRVAFSYAVLLEMFLHTVLERKKSTRERETFFFISGY